VVADWKIAASYDYIEALSESGWAFEFLRRNDAYRADFEEVAARRQELSDKYGDLTGNQAAWRGDSRAWVFTPEINPSETIQNWRRRAMASATEPGQEWFDDWYGRKWQLTQPLPDPSAPCVPGPDFNSLAHGIRPANLDGIANGFDDDEPHSQRAGTATLAFDLRLPLKHQLDEAKRVLERTMRDQAKQGVIKPLKNYTPGNTIPLFTEYLRALDGKAVGASNTEIASVLTPYKDNTAASGFQAAKGLADRLNQAQEYVESKYRVLPSMKFTSV
jgi:hypothetical protein